MPPPTPALEGSPKSPLFLPVELAIHVLEFIDDPRTLARVAQISRYWNRVVLHDQFMWKRMCLTHRFDDWPVASEETQKMTQSTSTGKARKWKNPQAILHDAYYQHFRLSYMTMMTWRRGGHLLRSHRMPAFSFDMGTISPFAINREWVAIGSDSKIYVFSAQTGVSHRTFVGHESGVHSVYLVNRGGHLAMSPEEKNTLSDRQDTNDWRHRLNSWVNGRYQPSLEHTISAKLRVALGLDVNGKTPLPPNALPGTPRNNCYASKGWGQPNTLVISGGCDGVLRVWDIKSRLCIYELRGHTLTISCVRVLDNRPIAVTGSYDTTLRIWNIQRGRMLRVLEGHSERVNCLDVCGNKAVSGSNDTTCRLWNIDTGECLHVFGHYYKIYIMAFNGVRIASGGLGTTIRLWDAITGQFLARFQFAQVSHLQLSSTMLVTGGYDGRVIASSLKTNNILYRIKAHPSSINSLQFDDHFLVTGGKDGRVKLFETQTGHYVRELSGQSSTVWKVGYGKQTCVVMCRRAGQTVMDIWSMRPKET